MNGLIIWTQSDPREARQGRPNYEINTRVIIAFREIGRGFSAMETFCGFMNIPSPMSKSTFADKFSLLHDYMPLMYRMRMRRKKL